jgi:hypothetical protein
LSACVTPMNSANRPFCWVDEGAEGIAKRLAMVARGLEICSARIIVDRLQTA